MRVGFDTETHPIIRSRVSPRVVCLSLAWDDAPPPIVWPEGCLFGEAGEGGGSGSGSVLVPRPGIARVWSTLLTLAEAGEVELVAHKASYDLLVLTAHLEEADLLAGRPAVGHLDRLLALLEDRPDGASPVVRCTQIRETLIAIAHARLQRAPRGYFSLAGCVSRYLGEDIAEGKGKARRCACGSVCEACDWTGWLGPWRLRYHQLDGVPLTSWPAGAVEYALSDAVHALAVVEAQDHTPAVGDLPMLDARGVRDEVPQLRADVAFALAAGWGVWADPERTATLAERVAGIRAEAHQIGLRGGWIRDSRGVAHAAPEAKPGRPGSECKAALRGLVEEAYGGIVRTTDKGATSTDRDTLLASGHPDLVAFAERGSDLTIARTYLPVLEEGVTKGVPITSSPNVLVATGRCSWRAPNWTNPPRDGGFRECVVPRPGHVLLAADYAAIEFRGLGQICLWEGFGRSIVDAFIAGADPHLDFAAHLLGVSYQVAEARLAAGDPEVAHRRQMAKVANYGFPGGLGAERFVAHARNQGVELGATPPEALAEAWRLRGQFRGQWPEMEGYFGWHGRLTEQAGYFNLVQYVSGRIRGEVGYTDGCNGRFQGLVADGAKKASWLVTRATTSRIGPLRGCRLVLFLHDELILEAPYSGPQDAGRLYEAGEELSRLMIEGMRPYIPDVPIEAEAAAMTRWVKGPKRITQDRRLHPC